MKRKIFCSVFIVVIVFLNFFIIECGSNVLDKTVWINVGLKMNEETDVQLFYSDGVFDVEHMVCQTYTQIGEGQVLSFEVPSNYSAWRIDYGTCSDNVVIEEIVMKVGKHSQVIDLDSVVTAYNNDIVEVVKESDQCVLIVQGDDPYTVFNMDKIDLTSFMERSSFGRTMGVKIAMCIIVDLFALFFILKSTIIFDVGNELLGQKDLVFNLAKNDFKTRYVGSYLGVVWAFIRPIVTVVVYWFVFQVGMKNGDIDGVPFVLWLMAGLVPWFYFSDALGNGTNSLIEYQYLVKKIVFNINTLPIVKIISAAFVHIVFILFMIVIYACYGYVPNMYTVQVLYYTICIGVFALALVYLTSAAVVFFRDITQIIGVVLEVGIWMTPIMWQLKVIPESLRWIFKLNPLYYIVLGYRNSLISKVWFWEDVYLTIYFWTITLLMLMLGTRVFNKLKVHFSDVL